MLSPNPFFLSSTCSGQVFGPTSQPTLLSQGRPSPRCQTGDNSPPSSRAALILADHPLLLHTLSTGLPGAQAQSARLPPRLRPHLCMWVGLPPGRWVHSPACGFRAPRASSAGGAYVLCPPVCSTSAFGNSTVTWAQIFSSFFFCLSRAAP